MIAVSKANCMNSAAVFCSIGTVSHTVLGHSAVFLFILPGCGVMHSFFFVAFVRSTARSRSVSSTLITGAGSKAGAVFCPNISFRTMSNSRDSTTWEQPSSLKYARVSRTGSMLHTMSDPLISINLLSLIMMQFPCCLDTSLISTDM